MLFHVMFNAYWEPLSFELPRVIAGIHGPWRRWIDTYEDAPHDVYAWPGGPSMDGPTCLVQPRSLAVLFTEREGATRR